MLAIEFYRKLKDLYRIDVSRSEFIYIYTHELPSQQDGKQIYTVTHVMFKFRKQKYKDVIDVPHDELLLSRDQKLPSDVIVQVKFSPLKFDLFEG